MQYRIRYERSPRNYCAWSPDLLGCGTVGDTLDECRREMREAIAFHLDGLAEDGDVRPRPTSYLEILDFPPEPAAVRAKAARATRTGPTRTAASARTKPARTKPARTNDRRTAAARPGKKALATG